VVSEKKRVSYVNTYRGSGGGSKDKDTAVVELSAGRDTLLLTATDGDGDVYVSLLGPRGGDKGTFRVYRETLADFVKAVQAQGMTNKEEEVAWP
jgi:hypothetical protein